MKINAKFEKVPYSQWADDVDQLYPGKFDTKTKIYLYDSIEMPRRATSRSSGYDFCNPLMDVDIPYNKTIVIPTGICCIFGEDGYDLSLYPRSGLGFKYRVALANTVGIIDNDYWESSNTGHIMVALTTLNDNHEPVNITHNKAFCQGIIRPFCIMANDNVEGARDGGFGSTDLK